MNTPTLPHDHHHTTSSMLSQLPEEQDFAVIAELFRLLGDSSRLRLFWILCHYEECLINLSAMMDMSSPALSHHLKQLKASGLVVSRRAGKEVYYRAAGSAKAELLHHFMEQLNHVVCPDEPQASVTPPSPQIQAIHQLLIEDLSQRHTIESLSRQFFIDSSTLKREFRQAYGLPIATYLKEYRLKKAMELLSSTDASIRVIAAQVGYETQSKFTAAFKSMTQLSPSEYRRSIRKT